MSDDMIARLRGRRERCHDLSGIYYTEDMDCQAAADRIEALERDRRIILDARDRTFALMLERAERAEAERERLALAICGGEDVPGYANAASVEELEGIARKAARDHMATINMMLRAEAERDAANALLRAWVELSEHCSIEEGVCCCGDYMESHSDPMNCGHLPFDHGAYTTNQLVENTRAHLGAKP